MSPETWLKQLRQHRAIAVIRTPDRATGYHLAQAVAAGGIRLIEITWNSSEPDRLIQDCRSALPHCTIGTGTLLTPDDLAAAIAAGAEFAFTPHTNPGLIAAAAAAGLPIIPGALTPTEIVTAWQAGATCVKVFPVKALGGAAYVRSLQDPIGHIPLIPTGGVTMDNAAELIAAGAIAVGLAGQLFPKEMIQAADWQGIADRAAQLVQRLAQFTGE
jgi:2-dehydro-3-deoxyphosphogluconate aldolase / (4S)-4-hydroxy-2-oxoglutarate aldolase